MLIFLIPAALPFVVYSSHQATCIRSNFRSYPITTYKIVLTSLAMWSFYAINVTSSTVPEKNKTKDPKAEQEPHKAKVAVTFPKEQNNNKNLGSGPSRLQSQLVFTWLLVVPPHQRKVGWREMVPSSLPAPYKSGEFRVPMHCPHRLLQWLLFLTQTSEKCVCEAEENSLKECECCRWIGPLLPVLLACGHHLILPVVPSTLPLVKKKKKFKHIRLGQAGIVDPSNL